jgi:ubiquinone/menaquinone biosynthesis C-methylase UbiE
MDRLNLRIPLSFSLERIEQEELLDLNEGSPADVAENLAEMQRINDVLGGTSALTRHLYPLLLRHSGPVTLLDVGTGGAGLPRRICSWAKQKRKIVRVLAVDRSWRSISFGQQAAGECAQIQLIQADALDLPLPAGSVDYVISTLFVHHLRPNGVQRMLREALRLARCGVVMSDLVRGWLPLAAFRVVQPFFARNYLTRHDGSLSIRRAYTPPELEAMAGLAGLPQSRVFAHFPWRMTLVVEK